MKNRRPFWWIMVALVLIVGHAVVSLAMNHGYSLAVFGGMVQSLLLGALFVVMLLNIRSDHPNARMFWGAMAVGSALWLAATLLGTWYEVILREPVKTPFVGDVLFFLHVVPMMGALALQPHKEGKSRKLGIGILDFVLLLVWWVYLYLFAVIPWQYIFPDTARYGFSFNLLYVVENTVLLVALALLWMRSNGSWKTIYANFFLAASLYAFASQIINGSIDRGFYYTGSFYGLPLIGAICCFVWTGLLAYSMKPKAAPTTVRQLHGYTGSRLAMIAVLSLPMVAFWVTSFDAAPQTVRIFRNFLTLATMVVLSFFIFLKQHFMDRELRRLLASSQQNLKNLKRLQSQLVQAEKLASLGQLVGGAAHEINNPLTAIIGYSDLLADDSSLGAEKNAWVLKIGQQARRTTEIVSNLMNFARQIPAERIVLNVNTVVIDAVDLRELDIEGANITIIKQLDPCIPSVWGDPNQLLQVCFQIIGNAIDAMNKTAGGALKITTRKEEGNVVLEFADSGPGIADPQRIFDPFYSTKPVGKGAGLGLSACYGIVQGHKGQIECQNQPEGGAIFTVRLPIFKSTPPTSVNKLAVGIHPVTNTRSAVHLTTTIQ